MDRLGCFGSRSNLFAKSSVKGISVPPLDPVTFAAVTAVLALTAAVATLAPALRATRVDPVAAFRND